MPRERSPPDAVLQIEQLERQDSGSGVSKGAATPSAIALKAQKDAQAAARGNSLRQCLVANGVLSDVASTSGRESDGSTSSACASGPHERGVSLHWLRTFAKCLVDKAGAPDDACTEFMVVRYIQPILRHTAKAGSCLWDLIPPDQLGKPAHYIIHAWQADFSDMVHTVSDKLDPPALPNQPPPPPVDATKIYVWIDFAAMPQGPNHGQSLLESGAVREIISSCKGGSLVVLDPELLVLRRAWCLMEVFLSVYTHQQDRMQVLFPEELELEWGMQLQTACSNPDLVKAETTRPDDKLQIVREVKRSVGMQKMLQIVSEGLNRAVRVALRWGGLERLTIYCAMLLHQGEYGLLFAALSVMPELQVEDMMLEEILTLFKLYDTDGSGELDEEEFVNALAAAGISKEEAIEMYNKCNADGGDGVSIEEFEKWWIDNQGGNGDQDAANGAGKKDAMTLSQLAQTLENFCKLLARSGLERHVDFFTDWCKRLEVQDTAKLVMPPTRGDWMRMIDHMNWKLTNDDVMGAGKLLYGFLVSNAELLSVDLKSISYVDADAPRAEQYKCISGYLDLLVELLKWYPARKKESRMLKEMVKKYRLLAANALDETLPSLCNVKPKELNKWQKSDKFIFSIVSKMAHLKHGSQHAMSQQVIKGAMRALSRWMANTRKSEGPYEAISQFSADYLASLETEAEVMNALGMGDGPPGSKQGSSGSHEGSNMWGMPSGSAMLLAHAASNAPPKPRSSVPGSVTTMAMSPRRSSLPSESFLPPLRTGSGSFDTTGRKLSHTSTAESLPSPKSLADFKPPVSRLNVTSLGPASMSSLSPSASNRTLDTSDFSLIAAKPKNNRTRKSTLM